MTIAALGTFSPEGRRAIRRVLVVSALLGVAIGLSSLHRHLTTDPLVDVHAYYDAGARLNRGLPLYDQPASTNDAAYYRYPPLVAIAFRPLAYLPFEMAAGIWEVVVLGCFAATIWWMGVRRRETWLVLGMLAAPIAWCLSIGQAQVPLTMLTAIGAPWSIALAANIKLFPAAVSLWWIGRRDWRSFGLFVASVAGLLLIQLILAPQAMLDYLTAISLKQVGEVVNISPYVVSPLLWAALVAAGVLLVLRLAPTRWGWAAAVTLSVVGTPRLLIYMLMTLVAVVAGPRSPSAAPRARQVS